MVSLSKMDPDTSLFERIGGRPGLMKLLRHFYADVRQHREIGPIFTARIRDWPAHLEKIADFWSNVIGGPIVYGGPMPQKHFPLGLEASHFETWLDLWRRNCRIYFPAGEAGELIVAAETIGERLRWLTGQFALRATGNGIIKPREA
jgi:hemoglobin